MKPVPLSDVKDQLSKYLRLAQKDGVVITRQSTLQNLTVKIAIAPTTIIDSEKRDRTTIISSSAYQLVA